MKLGVSLSAVAVGVIGGPKFKPFTDPRLWNDDAVTEEYMNDDALTITYHVED